MSLSGDSFLIMTGIGATLADHKCMELVTEAREWCANNFS